MTIKMAVVGSRTVTDKDLIYRHLDRCLEVAKEPLWIVSGGAKGVDSIAGEFAKDRGLTLVCVYPDWNTHGRSAGFKRNHEIWDIADCGIAFWDRESKGTQHSFDIAKKLNKKLVVIECDTLPW